MAQRRRWLMQGPWQHPKSGIWWYRKATPTDLRRRAADLESFGVKVTREVQQSLGTRDRKEAERLYPGIAAEVERRWDNWRKMLETGPVALAHREAVALAGHDARAYLRKHGAEPSEAPLPRKLLDAVCENVRFHHASRSLRDGQVVFELGQELLALPAYLLPERLAGLLKEEADGPRRNLAHAFAGALLQYREALGWVRAPKLAEEAGLAVTSDGRAKLAGQVAVFRDRIWEALKAYHDGDYRPRPFEEEGALPPLPDARSIRKDALTFGGIIDEQERLSGILSTGVVVSPATLRKYRTCLRQFAAFRGSDVAGTVTLQEANKWKERLGATDSLKTVRDKLTALRAVLKWGEEQTGEGLFGGRDPLKSLRLPKAAEGGSRSKAYSLSQARRVLEKARQETVPHLRWLPWLLAYTGMRIGEALQLSHGDLEAVGPHWFLTIRVGGGRSTKTRRARVVPVHVDLVKEGLVEYFKGVSAGRYFKGKSAAQRYGEWVRNVALADWAGSCPAPAHGFRHFWEAQRTAHIEERAALYIAGRASGTSADDYQDGRSKLPALAEQMNRLPSVFQ